MDCDLESLSKKQLVPETYDGFVLYTKNGTIIGMKLVHMTLCKLISMIQLH